MLPPGGRNRQLTFPFLMSQFCPRFPAFLRTTLLRYKHKVSVVYNEIIFVIEYQNGLAYYVSPTPSNPALLEAPDLDSDQGILTEGMDQYT
jgi:hypothetical protein